MGYSQTVLEGETIPTWARYAVLICHGHTRTERPDRDVIQLFSSRRACEAWARTIAMEFPVRTGDDLTLWALVYALGAERASRLTSQLGQCYLSLDPRAIVLKYHPVDKGYGVRAPSVRRAAHA